MALKQIDLDVIQPDGKRGLPGRTMSTIINENAAETEQRLGDLEGGSGGVSAAITALQQGQAALVVGQGQLQEGLGQETVDRTAQGAALGALIDAEQAARQAADEAIAARITGKNRFINGGLTFWQRRTSGRVGVGAGSLGSEKYFADRFSNAALGCTHDVLRFAPPDGKVKMICTVSGASAGSGAWFGQRIEGVRSLDGVVTISVEGSSDVAGRKIGIRVIQHFGTGGSPAADVSTEAGVITLGTADARKDISVVLPSTAGKNVGTSGTDHIYVVFDLCAGGYGGAISGQNGVFGLTEFQIEAGPIATGFEYRHVAEEEWLCFRYCEPVEFVQMTGVTFTQNGDTRAGRPFKVRKRANPSLTYTGTMNVIAGGAAGHVLNIDLGALQFGADRDMVVLVGIGNPGGLAPAGTVVSWGDNGAGRCTVLSDADF